MLRPIPGRILKQAAVLYVCTSVDAWQNPVFQLVPLERVVMQPVNETRRTKDNTEVLLRGLMFFDARRSTPTAYDFVAAQKVSEAAGHQMRLEFNGDLYTVQTIETLYDDEGFYHHAEIGLI